MRFSKKILIIITLATLISISSVIIISCSGGGTKYYNEHNNSYYMELKDDGTFYVKDMYVDVSGRYQISGSTITLTPGAGLPPKKGKMDGNTITDPDGEKWVKQ